MLVLGAVAAVGGGLCLGADGGLAVLVVGCQVDLLRVLGHVKREPEHNIRLKSWCYRFTDV